MLRPREENENKINIIKKHVKHIKRKWRMIKAKAVIGGALILWGLAAMNLCVNTWNRYTRKEDVVNAFSSEIYSDLTAQITANGYLGSMEITETAKYIILEEIAKKIGINRYEIHTVRTDATESTDLIQESPNGDVILKFVTVYKEADGEKVGENQYLCMRISLKQAIEAAQTYRGILQDVIDEYQIDTDVNVNLSGAVSGRMTVDEMRHLKDTLMTEIGGTTQEEKNVDDIYTVYGYEKNIDSYIRMGKKKVNVNITMSYDEENNQTDIHLATPINNQDF